MKKPKPRTDKAVQAEIEKLKTLIDRIPRITGFGDDNREAIHAEIDVLKLRMTEKEIDDRSWFEDEDEDVRDESKWSPHTHGIAMAACNWMNGYLSQSPSSGWEVIARKK